MRKLLNRKLLNIKAVILPMAITMFSISAMAEIKTIVLERNNNTKLENYSDNSNSSGTGYTDIRGQLNGNVFTAENLSASEIGLQSTSTYNNYGGGANPGCILPEYNNPQDNPFNLAECVSLDLSQADAIGRSTFPTNVFPVCKNADRSDKAGCVVNSANVEFVDLAHSGFNTDTGLYEIPFTMSINVVNPDFARNRLLTPSIFVYDPLLQEGYALVLNCDTEIPYGQWVLGSADDSTVYQSGTCIFVGTGGIKAFVKDFEPTANSNGDLIYRNLEPGLLEIDPQNPLLWRLELADALDSNFQLELQMRSVPVPAALWLFSSALLGLFGLKKLK